MDGGGNNPTNIQPLRDLMFNVASDLQSRNLVWIETPLKTGKQVTYKGEIVARGSHRIANSRTQYKGWQHLQHRYFCAPSAA